MPDEDAVFKRDAGADEGVALDLAARAHDRSGLNLDERPDARLVADAAAVQVREGLDDHPVAELDVGDEAMGRLVRGAGGPPNGALVVRFALRHGGEVGQEGLLAGEIDDGVVGDRRISVAARNRVPENSTRSGTRTRTRRSPLTTTPKGRR